MAHISELSWSRVEKPDEIVQAGDMVTVKLLKIETREGDTPKISLSIKQVDANPWDNMGGKFKPGDQVMGKVVRLAAFGAFVEIAPGVDGLVHISEMSHTKRVLRPEDVVHEGEQVQVVIKSIDQDSKRISLSIKDGLGDPWTGISTKYMPGAVVQVTLEKKETFGFFMNLEPGITGLMPISNIRNAAASSDYERLKPGDSISVLVQEVDEDNRRITLGSPEQKESDDWKSFAPDSKKETMGTMESLFREAMNKKK
jgi:small subunit ribosomal protein S1